MCYRESYIELAIESNPILVGGFSLMVTLKVSSSVTTSQEWINEVKSTLAEQFWDLLCVLNAFLAVMYRIKAVVDINVFLHYIGE